MEFSEWYSAIDVHAGGQPLRLLTGGLPPLSGTTQREKADDFRRRCDAVRRKLMAEPRGHYGMTGAVVTSPANEGSQLGLLFMNNEGMADVSGHGVIAAVTALIETGQLRPEAAAPGVRIDTPAGTVTAYAECEGAEVLSVSFDHVPSFAHAPDVSVALSGLSFTVDVVYSGAFYAVADARSPGGVPLEASALPDLQSRGEGIKRAVEADLNLNDPLTGERAAVHGVVIAGRTELPAGPDYRCVTVFAGGQIDRSPGGAGACAHMAARFARGELRLGDEATYEGIAGARAVVRAQKLLPCGKREGVVLRMTGSAFVTGLMNFVVDPADPLAEGFVLR
ncbi:proline racemase family protein [Paenibacillaceae bacterium WGS1546]|uniref:proline racemase family protein n=1 Tax=Cohnella sp. WGS1546 TaxID=3366810 RepID=UPI00372D04E8